MSPSNKIEKSSKIDKPGSSRDPRTRSDKASTIEFHNDKVNRLEEDSEMLEKRKEEDMFTNLDENKAEKTAMELKKYSAIQNQINLNPTPGLESGAAVEQQMTEPNATEPNATGLNAAGPNATGSNAIGPNVAEPNVTSNVLNPGTSHGNTRESPLKYGAIKKEYAEESKMPNITLVDNLDMEWDVKVNNTYVESSLQNHPKEAFGHIMRYSQARYCIRYGSADARSARFESALPDGSKYNETRDVTQRSNRIVEKIVQHHRDSKTALPVNILRKAKILLVYWDSKMGVGHDAEVEVLAPDFPERRPHTRCFIYLDPAFYAKYNIENKTGYSHETRSTMKLFMDGNDDRQKSISLHNIAVRLENEFEQKWMRGVSGRPEPLRELIHERKVVSRQIKSPYATAEPSASPTLMKPPISPRQPAPLPETPHKQAPTGIKPEMSLKQRFHNDFLELFDLAENVTYADLTEQQQLLYPAQFTKWKAVNA